VLGENMYHVYILKCADGSYYVGMTGDLNRRFIEHRDGLIKGYTFSRCPVELMWSSSFATHDEAFTQERRIKTWSRAKKEALIKNDWDVMHEVVKRERKTREAKKRDDPKSKWVCFI
jgi:predicted GIY-YIG superfamily endonuclease